MKYNPALFGGICERIVAVVKSSMGASQKIQTFLEVTVAV